MNGINIAEAGHVVNVFPAASISGGATGQAFHMKNAGHVSIVISFGARGAANPTAILVKQCTDANGSNATAIGFRFYYQTTSGAGNDTLAGPYFAAATGITSSLPAGAAFPTSVADLVYVIEIDSAELETASSVGTVTEYPYIQVSITDGGNTTYASIIAITSAQRYQYKGNQTITT